MWYVKNVPAWERAVRILAGLALGVWAVMNLGGWMGWGVAIGAGGMVVSGLIGFCPACAMIGRRGTN